MLHSFLGFFQEIICHSFCDLRQSGNARELKKDGNGIDT